MEVIDKKYDVIDDPYAAGNNAGSATKFKLSSDAYCVNRQGKWDS